MVTGFQSHQFVDRSVQKFTFVFGVYFYDFVPAMEMRKFTEFIHQKNEILLSLSLLLSYSLLKRQQSLTKPSPFSRGSAAGKREAVIPTTEKDPEEYENQNSTGVAKKHKPQPQRKASESVANGSKERDGAATVLSGDCHCFWVFLFSLQGCTSWPAAECFSVWRRLPDLLVESCAPNSCQSCVLC